MTIYLPSPRMRKLGIIMVFAGVAAFALTLILYHYSGKVVASAKLAEPVKTVSIPEQIAAMTAEKVLRNNMRKAGLGTFNVDDVEWLSLTFEPVHLTEGTEAAFQLKLAFNGVFASSGVGDRGVNLGYAVVEVRDRATGAIKFQRQGGKDLISSGMDNTHLVIDHTGRQTKSLWTNGKATSIVAHFVPDKEDDYILTMKVQKLRYADPVTDATLLIRTGMASEPSLERMVTMVLIIVTGMFLFIICTPPHLRKKKKN